MERSANFETQAIRSQMERTKAQEHSTPLYLTSSFIFNDSEEMRAAFTEENDKNIYSRYSNPNTDELIHKISKMEAAPAGFATATGMAAVFSTLAALLSSGDHLISCRSVFGSTYTVLNKILPKWNITTSYVDINNTGPWEQAINKNTKLIYVETPTNPAVDIIDLEWLGKFSKKHGLILVVDNCFATPYLQQPFLFGADLVIHSATKYIDGQGRVLGGIIVGKSDLVREIYLFNRNTGPALSPFNAWVLSKSLETLAVRMEKHCENALKLATWLESHDEVAWVKYPFLPSHPQHEIAKKQMKLGGGIVTFGVKGGLERGKKFLDHIQMCSLSANLGDTRTIVTHPSSTTHSKLTEEERDLVGISQDLIRVSVGLEHIDDIIADVSQALKASK